ncbi:hypothetical protein F5Y12DRAFT_800646 [Xylaria sp. FL1777]|nr:hypothetical protein F5Y12DRAFT_800646 [Xylaria sp. FL1777]
MKQYLTIPNLQVNRLYVALEYPEDPGIQHEHQPELLPEELRTQANGERELEYTWSFILTFEQDEQLHIKRYTIDCRPDAIEAFPDIMEQCIRNDHLLRNDCVIETSIMEPCLLSYIPRLMILLMIQDLDIQLFEAFLASHHWTPDRTAWGSHLTHLWARQVLMDCEATNINEERIISVEEAARTSVRQHQQLYPSDFDGWNPERQISIYDVNPSIPEPRRRVRRRRVR